MNISQYQPYGLFLLRVVTAYLFIQHGTAKLLSFPYVEGMSGAPLFSLYGAAAVIEIVGGVLLILGLCTRPAAFILSGEMAVAYFIGHVAPLPNTLLIPLYNGGEGAILFSFIFLYLFIVGGGAFAVDNLISRK